MERCSEQTTTQHVQGCDVADVTTGCLSDVPDNIPSNSQPKIIPNIPSTISSIDLEAAVVPRYDDGTYQFLSHQQSALMKKCACEALSPSQQVCVRVDA